MAAMKDFSHSVIVASRRAVAAVLPHRDLTPDLRGALEALSDRIGIGGPVSPDLLGRRPEQKEWPAPFVVEKPGIWSNATAGLQRSLEFGEAMNWLPESARLRYEAALKAIGRRPVVAPIRSAYPPEWPAVCEWACREGFRRHATAQLHVARVCWEWITGDFPWGARLKRGDPATAQFVDELVRRKREVVLAYSWIGTCSCWSCKDQRNERKAAAEAFRERRVPFWVVVKPQVDQPVPRRRR